MPNESWYNLNARLKRSSLGRFYQTDVEKELEGRHRHGTPYIAGSDTVTTNAIRLLPPGESSEPILDPATHSHLPHLPHGTAEILGASATGYLAGAGLISSLVVHQQAVLDEKKIEAMLHCPALASEEKAFEAGAAKRYLREGIKTAQFEKAWSGAAPAAGSAANLTGIFIAPVATAGLAIITLTGAKQAAESVKRAFKAHRAMKTAQRNVNLENQAIAETFFKELRNEQILNTLTWSTFTAGAGILTTASLSAQIAAIPLTCGAALLAIGTTTTLAGAAATTITNNKLKGNKFTGLDVNHLKKSLLNENNEPLSEREVDLRLGQAGKTRSIIKNYRRQALNSRSTISKAEFAALNVLRRSVSIATLGLIPQLSRSLKHAARDLAAKSIKPTHEVTKSRLKTLTSIAKMHAFAENGQESHATTPPSGQQEEQPIIIYERIAESVKAAQLEKVVVRRFAKKALRYDRVQKEDGSWTAQPRFSSKFLKKINIEDSDTAHLHAALLHEQAANPSPRNFEGAPTNEAQATRNINGQILPGTLSDMERTPAAQELIIRALDKELLFAQRNHARKNIAVYAKLSNAFAEQRYQMAKVHNGR